MKICLVHLSARPTPVYGEIAKHLRESGHEVWVANLDSNGDVVWNAGDGRQWTQNGPPSHPAGIPRSRLSNTIWTRVRQLAYVSRLRSAIRMLQPDIVQLNSSSLRFTCLVTAGMPHRTVYLLDFRQIGDRRLPATFGQRLRNGIRSLSRRESAVHCFDHTCFLHKAGAEKGLGPQWRRWGTVVPMGVHDQFLSLQKSQPARSAEPHKTRFVYVGSIARHRRLDILFKAIRAVADRTDNFEFHVLGRDAEDGFYTGLVQQLRLEPYVTFVPPLPYAAVPQKLLGYDAAIAYVPCEPTDWSFHPTLKVLEYRAIGIPIIATDLAPNRDYVLPEQNGLLCDNTVEDYAGAMLRFIAEPEFREKSLFAAERLRTGLSWLEVAGMYETLYVQLLSAKRR